MRFGLLEEGKGVKIGYDETLRSKYVNWNNDDDMKGERVKQNVWALDLHTMTLLLYR